MAMSKLPKDMQGEIAKEYFPNEVESHWYQWWEAEGFLKPRSDRECLDQSHQKFVVVLPPPNVTGFLHLGHALTGSVQDSLIRWHRMMGHNTLYVPGCDHAGIATQVVVEKKLKSEMNVTRHDLGREAFVEKVWEWKEKHGGIIQKQLRSLGLSLDWSRERFTMDAQCSKAVTEAFVRFYDDGILYRATALVNWCCSLKSVISDLEVEYIDVTPGLFIRIPNYEKTVEVGTITAFAYKIVGTDEEIIVETTRPETILGDTAVAVHPADPRYTKYAGAKLQCPFRDECIPLIFDEKLVDMTFGTGAVKVTPAHDPNDFECGTRNKLPFITIFDTSGIITAAGKFQGMHRYDCRRAIVKALDEAGLLRGQKGHAMRLGTCSRTGDIIEPFVLPQWFLNCSKMAGDAVQAVRTGDLKLTPSSHEKTWFHWLENIRPWCISRQLWWGHRIPAYFCTVGDRPISNDEQTSWVVGRTETEARERAISNFGLNSEQAATLKLSQDEDVLDTWFSSALWPMSLMGWPNESTNDMKLFFPTSLLETGHDIIFFWVARMVMTSLHLTKQLPFTEVYMHAMVRDKNGEKMSKSKGNVIDPLDVLSGISLEKLNAKLEDSNLDRKEISRAKELQQKTFPKGIPECGADALRFGLLTYTVSGKNVNLDIDRIVGYRQFCNKLWNVVRYALYHSLGADYDPPKYSLSELAMPLECKWILSRFDETVAACIDSFTEGQYDFSKATSSTYSFWLNDFCDVFLELTKPRMKKMDDTSAITKFVLYIIIEKALRMLHPMMPFVTEELWHRLPKSNTFSTPSIMLANYPRPEGHHDKLIEEDMTLLLSIVHSLRSTKSNYQLTNKVKPDVWILSKSVKIQTLLKEHGQDVISTLACTGEVSVAGERSDIPAGCGYTVLGSDVTVCIMLKGIIDPVKEQERLTKKITSSKNQLESLEKKINGEGYKERVPVEIQQGNTEKQTHLKAEINQLQEAFNSILTISS